MSAKPRRPSPILGAASAMIDEASDTLVTATSRFRHSFEVEVGAIRNDPHQPRKWFGEDDIASLARTMNERGQLQPILLRRDPVSKGRWLIVAGERRWRAAKLNNWTTILAIEHDGDSEVASLLENLQRVDLSPIEEAKGLQSLIQGKGWTQDQAAGALGKSKSEVSGMLRILTLPGDFLEAVLTSELDLPKNALVELARVENPSEQDHLLRLARAGQLTIRAIRAGRGGNKKGDSENLAEPRKDIRQPSVKRFNLNSIERLTVKLRELRASGKSITDKEKSPLEHLRREIEGLLRM